MVFLTSIFPFLPEMSNIGQSVLRFSIIPTFFVMGEGKKAIQLGSLNK